MRHQIGSQVSLLLVIATLVKKNAGFPVRLMSPSTHTCGKPYPLGYLQVYFLFDNLSWMVHIVLTLSNEGVGDYAKRIHGIERGRRWECQDTLQ